MKEPTAQVLARLWRSEDLVGCCWCVSLYHSINILAANLGLTICKFYDPETQFLVLYPGESQAQGPHVRSRGIWWQHFKLQTIQIHVNQKMEEQIMPQSGILHSNGKEWPAKIRTHLKAEWQNRRTELFHLLSVRSRKKSILLFKHARVAGKMRGAKKCSFQK